MRIFSIFYRFFSEITLLALTSKTLKTRSLYSFGSNLRTLNALSRIMAHVVNEGLLSEYVSSVYKFKTSYKYASVFRTVMINLITELFTIATSSTEN